jgi:hypothetical protein
MANGFRVYDLNGFEQFFGKTFAGHKKLGNSHSQILFTPIFLLLGVYIGDIYLRAKMSVKQENFQVSSADFDNQ